MNRQVRAELSEHDCVCRYCDKTYIGHGALCDDPKCRYKAGMPTPKDEAQSVAFQKEHKRKARAEKRARARTEWKGLLDVAK